MLHERSNITASFAEHLKFKEKLTFSPVLWINCGKLKKKTRIKKLNILKLLYTGCLTKEETKLLPRGASEISRINDFYTYTLGK